MQEQEPLVLDVRPYSIEALKDIIVAHGQNTERHVLDAKQQFEYFDSYLRHEDIQACTIVAESPYIDRDYLLDYAAYYVRCFNSYRRWCTRLHFFSCPFNQAQFEEFLYRGKAENLSEELLQEKYLGFMVAKPLPETVIGRTCLKTYDEEEGRVFPHVLEYPVNLVGLQLTVKSLPYQEQDTVAAACAASALWSAFHGTGTVFQHQIPAPAAITESARRRIPSENRIFPATGGLTDPQMAEAIREVGLDPLLMAAGSNWLLQAVAYAYLRAGIPVLMNCTVGDYLNREKRLSPDALKGHAIALVGYRIDESMEPTPGNLGLLLRSSQISKVYGHDDQVGPFARMEFSDDFLEVLDLSDPEEDFAKKRTRDLDYINCVWGDAADLRGNVVVSERVLIPLPTTIRISFDSILNTLMAFDSTLEELRSRKISGFADNHLWDLYLVSSNQLKSEWLQNSKLSPKLRRQILHTTLPRFVWRISACDARGLLVDFLFDPTDIDQGPMIIDVIGYDQEYYNEFLRLADVYTHSQEYEEKERRESHGRIWEYLRFRHQQAQSAQK